MWPYVVVWSDPQKRRWSILFADNKDLAGLMILSRPSYRTVHKITRLFPFEVQFDERIHGSTISEPGELP